MTTPGTSTAAPSGLRDIQRLAERVSIKMELLLKEWEDVERAKEVNNKICLFVSLITSAKRLLGKLEAEEEDVDHRRQEAETDLAEQIRKVEAMREQLQTEKDEQARMAEEMRGQLQAEKDEHARMAEEILKQLQAEKEEYTRKVDEYARKLDEYSEKIDQCSTNAARLAAMLEKAPLAEDSSTKEL